MEQKVTRAIYDSLPGSEITKQMGNLAIRLRLFLDIKDADYYMIQSLTVITRFDELKLEEAILSEESTMTTSAMRARSSIASCSLA